jgi:hypothetical protein
MLLVGELVVQILIREVLLNAIDHVHNVRDILLEILPLLKVPWTADERGGWLFLKGGFRLLMLWHFQVILYVTLPDYNGMGRTMSEMFRRLNQYWCLRFKSAGSVRTRKGLSLPLKVIYPLHFRGRIAKSKIRCISRGILDSAHGGRKVLDPFNGSLVFIYLLFFGSDRRPSVSNALCDRFEYADAT